METKFKLHRTGTLIAKHPDNSESPSQCKQSEYLGVYDYHITCYTNSNLNEHGFIIDHNFIDETIRGLNDSNPFPSCERASILIALNVYKLLRQHKVECMKIKIQIKPLNAVAWIDSTHRF